VQDALATHLAIKDSTFAYRFNPNDGRFKTGTGLQPASERLEQLFEGIKDKFQGMRIHL
jgi:hypothetical protein